MRRTLFALLSSSILLVAGCGTRTAQLRADGGGLADDVIVPPRPDASSGPTQGFIWLAEISEPISGAQQGTVRASFWNGPHPFLTPLRSFGGGCAEYSGQDSGNEERSAGTLRIEGSNAGTDITLEPGSAGPDRYLYDAILFPELFDANTLVRVSASGGAVPAFFGAVGGVDAPSLPTLPPLRRGEDWRLGPIKAAAGSLFWVIFAAVQGGPTSDTLVRCELTLDASGSIEVPWEAIAALPAASKVLGVLVGTVQRSVVQQNAHEVQLLTTHLSLGSVPLL